MNGHTDPIERRRQRLKALFFMGIFVVVNALIAYQFFRAFAHWLGLIRIAGIESADVSKAGYSLLGMLGIWIVAGAVTGTLSFVTRARRLV
jgi:hypothetical protein